MREKLAALARRISERQESLRKLAAGMRANDPSLVEPVEKASPPLSVCAVDGGLLAERMHGADILLCRAVAVRFDYSGSAISGFAHHPGKNPAPVVEINGSLDESEALMFRSLVRLRQELSCALEAVRKWSPGALLLDGSLLPLPCDRPPRESVLRPLYGEVLGLHGALYSECGSRKCMLLGVVKDSRSRKLAESLGADCSDTLLCGYLLNGGERTRGMPYFSGKAPPADLAALGSGVDVFYIKPSKNDLPLRIEALGTGTSRAASLILALSAISENFAYPAALVEADMRAALDPAEMEIIESMLASLSGMRPLRRNSRPFR
jgi:hypothetical protein